MPLFSIIVPVFNTQDYIRECIESILLQTFSDYECILINDGSTDNSPALCNEYALKDNRFMVIHQINKGLSMARNAGILKAQGDYIILLDSDDILMTDSALNNLSEIITKNKPDVIYHSNLNTFSDNHDFTSLDAIKDDIISFNIKSFIGEIKYNSNILLGSCFFTINRNFILQNDLFFKEGIFHEDEHFSPRLLCSAEIIYINHKYFYGYRHRRPGSITFDISPKRLFDYIVILNDLLLLAKQEKIPYKKNVYYYTCKHIWIKVFNIISNFNISSKSNNIDNETKYSIARDLKPLSSCLLHDAKLKHILAFLCIHLLGINIVIKIRGLSS